MTPSWMTFANGVWILEFEAVGANDLAWAEHQIGAAAVRGRVDLVQPADLLSPYLRWIVEAARSVDMRGELVNASSIVAEPRATGITATLLAEYVVELVALWPLWDAMAYYTRVIGQAARRRRIARAALDLYTAAKMDEGVDAALVAATVLR